MRSPTRFLLPAVIAIHGLCQASKAATLFYSDAALWTQEVTTHYSLQTATFSDMVLTPGPTVYYNQGSLTVQGSATFSSANNSITVGPEAGNFVRVTPFYGTIRDQYFAAVGLWIDTTSADWRVTYDFGFSPQWFPSHTYSETSNLVSGFIGMVVTDPANEVPDMWFTLYNSNPNATMDDLVVTRMDYVTTFVPEVSSLALLSFAPLLGFRRSRKPGY